MYCIIQIAYFKAKHLFFHFGWDDVPDDCSFVLSRYFPGESLQDKLPYKQERYAQREQICALYGYRPWSSALSSPLEQQAARIVHRDVTPGFVATELIIWLNEHKIIRPGYTTLQVLVSRTLSDERQRLGRILRERLDDATIDSLNTLIERDDTLSRLAILRQDARDFGWRQMVQEREKRAILAPLHRKACDILPALNISQQNLLYYASLANFYTVYDLRKLKPDQTRLYLLCYAWVRYRQFCDNLVDAMFFHINSWRMRAAARPNSFWPTSRKNSGVRRLKSDGCYRFTLMTASRTQPLLAKSAGAHGKLCRGRRCKPPRSA